MGHVRSTSSCGVHVRSTSSCGVHLPSHELYVIPSSCGIHSPCDIFHSSCDELCDVHQLPCRACDERNANLYPCNNYRYYYNSYYYQACRQDYAVQETKGSRQENTRCSREENWSKVCKENKQSLLRLSISAVT